MPLIHVGEYNTLTVSRKTPQGLYLGDPEVEEVLLPWKYAPANTLPDTTLRVFVYLDSEDRLIATTQEPKITLHRFALLEVKDVTQHGAFLDWGLDKDLFVPFREQSRKMEKGQHCLVYLYLDEESERLAASSRLNRFLSNTELSVKEGEEVEAIMWEPTELGMKVIVNQQHKGLIYHNELHAQVRVGDVRRAYIRRIREENKLDVALQPTGYKSVVTGAGKLLQTLRDHGGYLPLTDNSDPAEISKLLEMSKKTFKKAVGALYKERIIRLEANGIYLNEAHERW